MTLQDQTVVVIGGASGIGRAVARQAAAKGSHLVLAGRDEAKLAAAAKDLGAEARVLDAHDLEAVEQFFDTLNPVDHLVSMVGDSMSGGFLGTSSEVMSHTLHSKLIANWNIARAAVPKVRDGGSLTFTAGTGGRPHEVSATYVANLGLAAIVAGVAVESAPRVRVNAVAPTFMDTPFWRNMSPDEVTATREVVADASPLKRLATVDEVASTYLHLMVNGYITGQTISVDGGIMLVK